jgi:single-strand DNA-binding protein
MSGVNKCIFVGNVGKDPEVKSAGSGTVANFSIAINEKWKNKEGEPQERVEWVRVVAWGKLAEIVGKYVTKGKQLYVEGRLQTDKYQKNGVDTYSTKVVANQIQLLGKKGEDGPGRDDAPPDDDQDRGF